MNEAARWEARRPGPALPGHVRPIFTACFEPQLSEMSFFAKRLCFFPFVHLYAPKNHSGIFIIFGISSIKRCVGLFLIL